MKILRTRVLVALLLTGCLQATAQSTTPPLNEPAYNKPKVFTDLPEKFPFRLADAEDLLNLPVGTYVNTTLASGFQFKGTVVSKSDPADRLVKSVVVKGATRGGVSFTFTRIKKANGSFAYKGRMLGKDAGDALEVVQDGPAYAFRKKAYYDMINE